MKAKVKRTGRIIDVAKTQFDGFEWHYIDIETSDDYVEKQLDFQDLIDWEQRRFDMATKISSNFISSRNASGLTPEAAAGVVYDFTESLISLLRFGKKENKE